jgi:hypothetical protein
MQGYNAQQQSKSDMFGGLGQIAGGFAGSSAGSAAIMSMFADGGKAKRLGRSGKVSGPGGPVDDKIPAMLSDGEYVLPADTVKAIGVKKLDKIVKKTHTPAAVQKRKALGKRSA